MLYFYKMRAWLIGLVFITLGFYANASLHPFSCPLDLGLIPVSENRELGTGNFCVEARAWPDGLTNDFQNETIHTGCENGELSCEESHLSGSFNDSVSSEISWYPIHLLDAIGKCHELNEAFAHQIEGLGMEFDLISKREWEAIDEYIKSQGADEPAREMESDCFYKEYEGDNTENDSLNEITCHTLSNGESIYHFYSMEWVKEDSLEVDSPSGGFFHDGQWLGENSMSVNDLEDSVGFRCVLRPVKENETTLSAGALLNNILESFADLTGTDLWADLQKKINDSKEDVVSDDGKQALSINTPTDTRRLSENKNHLSRVSGLSFKDTKYQNSSPEELKSTSKNAFISEKHRDHSIAHTAELQIPISPTTTAKITVNGMTPPGEKAREEDPEIRIYHEPLERTEFGWNSGHEAEAHTINPEELLFGTSLNWKEAHSSETTWSAWGQILYGGFDNEEDEFRSEEIGPGGFLGAMGTKGPLFTQNRGDWADLTVRTDALWKWMNSQTANGMDTVENEVTQFQLTLDAARTFERRKSTLTPSFQIGMRHNDRNDTEIGTGFEMGGALRYAVGSLILEGTVRRFLPHEKSEQEEWGASGALRIDPNESGRGLFLSIMPTWGTPFSRVDLLWSPDGRMYELTDTDNFGSNKRLDAKLGYGSKLLKGGLFKSYANVSLIDRVKRTLRTGLQWDFTPETSLSLEMIRNRDKNNVSSKALTLSGNIQW